MKRTGDLDRLQGTWTITSLEANGATMPAAALDGATITIDGDAFVTAGMGAGYRGRIEVDATAKPRALDLHFTAGPPAGTTNPCIYELKGDTLTLCVSMTSGKRPKTFAAPAGSGFALETLVRGAKKTAASAKTKRAKSSPKFAAAALVGAKGATEIEGEWQMVSGVVDGETMAASLIQWVRRITKGNVTSVVAGPNVMMRAEFSLDPSRSPKAIDYLHLEGNLKGKAQPGI
ncbi:MAG: TIGR03067 domain-containing protein [Candidatus Eisenbacteria bacterium]|nr:TIGR03067 domain-containing protein [Candidatus Eisenbacteria bacterium]